MIRITKEHLFMEFAKQVSLRSTCERLKVGAVIVTSDFKYVVGYGYNGNYASGPNCCDSPEEGNCGCIHAEVNALIKCNEKKDDCYMFVTVSPCMTCAKLILNAGNIKVIFFKEAYRDHEPLMLLQKEGVMCIPVS